MDPPHCGADLANLRARPTDYKCPLMRNYGVLVPERGEEPVCGRDDPVASALALHSREPPVGDLHVGEPQAQHLA